MTVGLDLPARTACPECKTEQPVTKTGAIRKHKAGTTGSAKSLPCPGSGLLIGAARIPRRSKAGFYKCHVTGQYLRSVTTILNQGSPKPALIPWAAGRTADLALSNVDYLVEATSSDEGRAEAYRWLRDAHVRIKDERADLGTAVHDIVEAKVLGEPIPESVLADPEMAPFAKPFEAFVSEWQVEFTAAEMVVANYTAKYAGKLDFMFRSPVLSAQWGLPPKTEYMGDTTFGFRDLLLLRTTKGLLESGVPMRRIRRIWSSLRAQLAGDVPLTSITIRADGEQVVATDGRSAWRPDSGQVLLDFEASEIAERARTAAPRTALEAVGPEPVSPRPLVTPVDPAGFRQSADTTDLEEPDYSAEEWYEIALGLESGAPTEAIEAFRRALALDPTMADGHVNLGRLYHLMGERGRAEAHYRDAVRLAPEDPVPHFNLGVLMEEQGRREEAVHAYLQAVHRDPDFGDAHCNLGLLLESLGRRQEAVQHLMAASRLSGADE